MLMINRTISQVRNASCGWALYQNREEGPKRNVMWDWGGINSDNHFSNQKEA